MWGHYTASGRNSYFSQVVKKQKLLNTVRISYIIKLDKLTKMLGHTDFSWVLEGRANMRLWWLYFHPAYSASFKSIPMVLTSNCVSPYANRFFLFSVCVVEPHGWCEADNEKGLLLRVCVCVSLSVNIKKGCVVSCSQAGRTMQPAHNKRSAAFAATQPGWFLQMTKLPAANSSRTPWMISSESWR